ncbi:MAG: EVE domain-containing protein [Planctomycetaceae bacterium]
MPPSSVTRHWLFKTEPATFSINDLAAAPDQSTCWNGVRNYQARNFLRDTISVGDGVLLYHSNAQPLAIVGTARVVRAGYPDSSAWDPRSPYHDPASRPDHPIWYMVDIQLENRFERPVERARLQEIPQLSGMLLLQRGSRLSVQPVSRDEWRVILELAAPTRKSRR